MKSLSRTSLGKKSKYELSFSVCFGVLVLGHNKYYMRVMLARHWYPLAHR